MFYQENTMLLRGNNHCSDLCANGDGKYYAVANNKCGVVCLNPIYYTFAEAVQPNLSPSTTNTPCQDNGYKTFINNEKR